MKKLLACVYAGVLLIALVSLSTASEKDKGSMMHKGSTMEAETAVEAVVEQVEEKGSEKKSEAAEWSAPNAARAMILGTAKDSKVNGSVDFVETGDGIQVVASLSGVTPAGKHGIHVHAEGSCDDGGKAAGGHFNPVGTDHGLLPRDGQGKAHIGDMGNVEIDANGDGALVIFMPGLSLSAGHTNITGKAVILHAKEDDFGQPTGNAGARIGCGIIKLN